MHSSLHMISNSELLSRMDKLVRTERKITHLILLHICEIEDRRIYAEKGFDGMYSYLTRGLGYSEAAAYRRLQSARLLKQLPEVGEKVQDGSLNLSQLTQVQKCVKAKLKYDSSDSTPDMTQVLSKIENKNTFETQSILAQEFNVPIKSEEILKPQKDKSVRLEITLTVEQFLQLQQAKDLLSHVVPQSEWAEVISSLAQNFNQRKLGRKKIKQKDQKQKISENNMLEHIELAQPAKPLLTQDILATKSSNSSKKQTVHSTVSHQMAFSLEKSRTLKTIKKTSRKYISIHTRREVFRRANHCCEYVDPSSGRSCLSTYQLQVEHIVPIAHNGGDELQNLKALCRTHNLLMAEKLELLKLRSS